MKTNLQHDLFIFPVSSILDGICLKTTMMIVRAENMVLAKEDIVKHLLDLEMIEEAESAKDDDELRTEEDILADIWFEGEIVYFSGLKNGYQIGEGQKLTSLKVVNE